jgi:iron-sulfur cluster assembly protein
LQQAFVAACGLQTPVSEQLRETAMITLTPSARQAIERFVKGAAEPVAGLRVLVAGGGCSGFEYGMRIERSAAEDDLVLDLDGVTVLVDAFSATMLSGVTIDFVDSLEGSGFKFDNPNATQTCACGQSFTTSA